MRAARCPLRACVLSADELIRQVAINCAERGLLLLRVRDELQMTLRAYQTLYESSVAFGMRKALMAEQGKSDLERKVRRLPSIDRLSLTTSGTCLVGTTGRGQARLGTTTEGNEIERGSDREEAQRTTAGRGEKAHRRDQLSEEDQPAAQGETIARCTVRP